MNHMPRIFNIVCFLRMPDFDEGWIDQALPACEAAKAFSCLPHCFEHNVHEVFISRWGMISHLFHKQVLKRGKGSLIFVFTQSNRARPAFFAHRRMQERNQQFFHGCWSKITQSKEGTESFCLIALL